MRFELLGFTDEGFETYGTCEADTPEEACDKLHDAIPEFDEECQEEAGLFTPAQVRAYVRELFGVADGPGNAHSFVDGRSSTMYILVEMHNNRVTLYTPAGKLKL